MFWHFDQMQWWGYYSHAGQNFGGLFSLRPFFNEIDLLKSGLQNLQQDFIQTINRRHWGEQPSRIPFNLLQYLASCKFEWEVRCPEGLRLQKINNNLIASQYLLLRSAHFLPNVPENHKCRRLHGHNFGLWISILIPSLNSDAAHSIEILQDFSESISAELDCKILNKISGLENPTSENIARWIFNRFAKINSNLVSVLCIETATSAASYNRHDQWLCWKSFDFESVWAPNPEKTIGHSFRLSAGISGKLKSKFDWVLDFSEIKAAIQPLINQLDHQDLSKLMQGRCNTAEGLLSWMREQSPDCLNASYCLQNLPSSGTYLIASDLDFADVIPFFNWGM